MMVSMRERARGMSEKSMKERVKFERREKQTTRQSKRNESERETMRESK